MVVTLTGIQSTHNVQHSPIFEVEFGNEMGVPIAPRIVSLL